LKNKKEGVSLFAKLLLVCAPKIAGGYYPPAFGRRYSTVSVCSVFFLRFKIRYSTKTAARMPKATNCQRREPLIDTRNVTKVTAEVARITFFLRIKKRTMPTSERTIQTIGKIKGRIDGENLKRGEVFFDCVPETNSKNVLKVMIDAVKDTAVGIASAAGYDKRIVYSADDPAFGTVQLVFSAGDGDVVGGSIVCKADVDSGRRGGGVLGKDRKCAGEDFFEVG